MARMVAAQVIVPFEIAVIVPHVPVAPRLQAMDQAAVVQDRQIKATAVPGDQLRAVAVNALEESPDELGFRISCRSQRPYAKIIFVTQCARNRHDLLDMQWQEFVTDSLAARLKRHFGNIIRDQQRIQTMKLAQPLHVGNSLDIKNQDGYQFIGIMKSK